MLEESSFVPLPVQNEQNTIWRYIDFTKFVSLLDKKSLFFCRADKLDDPFEGSSTVPNVETWKRSFYKQGVIEGKMGFAMMDQLLKEYADGKKSLKQLVNINSWYMKEYESAAMWQLYAQSNEAVAIRSTVKRLRESLPTFSQLFIGRVQYIDYRKEGIPEKYITDRFFCKQKSFEYEEEVRAILLNLNSDWLSSIQAVDNENGIYVKVQIDTLIDEIFVAPKSPNWFKELVENVPRLYGDQKDVKRTSLDDKVLY
jgi:hypothetical protein